MPQPSDAYDSPWKEALEVYLRSMLELCFPHVAEAIDWAAGFEFLDKELQEIARDAALGEQRVDKLARVQLRDGAEEWILIHVEVQHQPDMDLPLRVYQYHHRVRDRFGKKVASLVILADERADWRPNHYQEEVLGCRVRFDFLICKLLDLVTAAEAASRTGQPSAVIILANWATQRTRGDMRERLRWKWDLTRRLYEAGLSRNEILELYRLVDWLMRLPDGLEREYKNQLKDYERSKVMPYVTSIERMGREEAVRESIVEVLEARLGAVPSDVRQRLTELDQTDQLKRLLRHAGTCASLAEFQRALEG